MTWQDVTITGSYGTSISCDEANRLNGGLYFQAPEQIHISMIYIEQCGSAFSFDPNPGPISPTFPPLPRARSLPLPFVVPHKHIILQNVFISECDVGLNITGATSCIF